MELKVVCLCGTKFAFEVEPVDGRVPSEIACPECGADVTDLANESLTRHLAPARPRIRVATPAQKSATIVATAEGAEMCHRHPTKAAEAHCVACHKPICGECMDSFGYLCSIACRYRAEQEGIVVPLHKSRRGQAEARESRRALLIASVIGIALLVAVCGWFWFVLKGSKPSPAYTLKVPSGEVRSSFWAAENQFIILKDDSAALHDVKGKKNLWSTSFGERTNGAKALRGNWLHAEQLWLALGDEVIALNLKTGAIQHRIPLGGSFESARMGSGTLLCIAAKQPQERLMTHINLSSGATKSFAVPATDSERVQVSGGPQILPTAAALMQRELDDPQSQSPTILRSSREYFPARDGVIEMQVVLREIKIGSMATMKAPGPSNLNGDTTASTSARAVLEEISNELKRNRTGGVRSVDESRYEVTLGYLSRADSPGWKGEVTGLPVLMPQRSVHALVAGKKFLLFDERLSLVGESTLQYPIADRFTARGDASWPPPCLETNDLFLFYDQGLLTAFRLPGANVLWRVPTVGITRMDLDEKKMLYVATTTGAPEDVQYSEQIKLNDAARSIILKIDPRSGKTLWKSEATARDFHLTGKFVYASETPRAGFGMANAVEEAFGTAPRRSSFQNIYRVKPSSGKTLWLYQINPVQRADFFGNQILLQRLDSITVADFLSF